MSPCAHRKQTFCFPRCRLVAAYNALNSASCRSVKNLLESSPSYRQILVTAGPVRRRRLWADGQRVWR